MAETSQADLFTHVEAWIDDDPDPATAEELRLLLTVAQDPRAAAAGVALLDLQDRFSGPLEFGTAGLRGRLGGGPNRMNRAVVIRAAAGLTAYLKESTPQPTVVIGFDARHNSDVFARDTAAVVVGAGGQAMVLPRPLPTPVLAYAIRALGADAGVMVTASHNPPEDNGYKVYLGDGSQIVPPADAEISAHIAAVTSVRDVYLPTDGWQTLGDNVQRDYIDAVVGVLQPDGPREVVIVHTSLHGVGNDTMMRAFRQGGFTEVNPVLSQADPDPDFPTVSFPNPEEPGAMDAALDLAEQTEPDIVIANDPDADRCAAAIAGPGGWRMLRGDEVGTLLGAYLLGLSGCPRAEHLTGTDVVFANSIVSSRQLAALCQSVGVRHEETLTGFKWIARVPGLGFGYEEALGYCVDPATVRDKDGISAALLLAELTAGLKAQGRSISDLLDELATAHGVYATDAYSVRVTDLALIAEIMTRLRSTPITEVAGVAVTRTDDLAQGDGGLPPTEGLRYYLADDSRIIVRPSGTEPKLKVYLEVIEPVAESDPANLKEARSRAAERLASLIAGMKERTA